MVAIECLRMGEPLPIPKYAVCKFCILIKRSKKIYDVVCDRPDGILVPPFLCCIDNLGREHKRMVVRELRKAYVVK